MWPLLLVPFCWACASETATEVIVALEVESGLRDDMAVVRLRAEAREPGAERGEIVFETALARPGRPETLSLAPEDGGRDYLVTAKAIDDRGLVLATARLRSDYQAGQRRYVWLILEDACRRVKCDGEQTCTDGACVDGTVDSADFGAMLDGAPTSASLID